MDYCKKDLAVEFGVTTQAIDKRINKLNLRDKCTKDESNRLWIPQEIAELIAESYGKRLQEVVTECQPEETDWKSLYLQEKERNDTLSDELIALSKSNQELAGKVTDLLSREKALEQNERLLAQEERAKGLLDGTDGSRESQDEIIEISLENQATYTEEDLEEARREAAQSAEDQFYRMGLMDRIMRRWRRSNE